jgi:hypothetical protein
MPRGRPKDVGTFDGCCRSRTTGGRVSLCPLDGYELQPAGVRKADSAVLRSRVSRADLGCIGLGGPACAGQRTGPSPPDWSSPNVSSKPTSPRSSRNAAYPSRTASTAGVLAILTFLRAQPGGPAGPSNVQVTTGPSSRRVPQADKVLGRGSSRTRTVDQGSALHPVCACPDHPNATPTSVARSTGTPDVELTSVCAGHRLGGAPRRNRTGDPILTMEPPGTAVRTAVSPAGGRSACCTGPASPTATWPPPASWSTGSGGHGWSTSTRPGPPPTTGRWPPTSPSCSPPSRRWPTRTTSARPRCGPSGPRPRPAAGPERPGRVIGSARRRPPCGCSSMAELEPSKLVTRVRFPSPAPAFAEATALPASALPPYCLRRALCMPLRALGVPFAGPFAARAG